MPQKLLLASEFELIFESVKERLLTVRRTGRVVFIPTAAYGEGWEPDPEQTSKPFKTLGMQVSFFDLQGKTAQETRGALEQADIIYVGGGNSFFLLDHMRKARFPEILKDAFASGSLYLGSSAGSIVCSPDIAFIAPMDDPTQAPTSGTKGLDLIDFLFLPHLDHPQHAPTSRKIAQSYEGETPLLALKDRQALWIENKTMSLLGNDCDDREPTAFNHNP